MKIMKSVLLFISSFIALISNAQIATYVQTFGSSNIEQISGVQVNAQQEIFLAGTFGADLMIDNNNLLINGLEDIFLCKKDGNNQTVWTKTFGSNDRDKITGLRLYNDTMLYFSGIFWDNLTLDSFSLSANSSSVFIAAADTSGHIRWATSIDGSGLLKVNEGVVDNEGNYILTGSYSNDLFFPNNTLTAAGTEDGFLAKYDKHGNFLWAQQFGYQQQTIATSVITDSTNHIYIAGQFNGRVIFGSDTLWASANDYDLFLAQYNEQGDLQYGQRFGGIYDNTNPKLGINSFGELVMSGTFIGLLNLDDQTTLQTNSNVDSDIFVVTFTQMGQVSTVKQFGDITNETLVNLHVHANHYYLSGFFNTSTTIGDISLTTAFGNLQNFMIRTAASASNASPNVISYATMQPSAVAFAVPFGNANDEVVIAGTFQGAINLPVATSSPVSNGFTDIFLVKMTLPPVSTFKVRPNMSWTVFPNPASDFIDIDCTVELMSSPITISIISTSGAVVQELTVANDNRVRVPIYYLPKGIYFLEIKTADSRQMKQFIKM